MSDSKANEVQIGGSHYQQPDGGEQHWDRCWRLKLDYFQSAITKYVERCWLKNGLEDLRKAAHYLQKYIELNSPPAAFQPTHRHAEGGMYRVLDDQLQVHMATIGDDRHWEKAVRYRNEAGEEFVREAEEFARRFTALNDGAEPTSAYTNQDQRA